MLTVSKQFWQKNVRESHSDVTIKKKLLQHLIKLFVGDVNFK